MRLTGWKSFLAAAVPLYLGLLWLVSSVSHRTGVWIFLIGIGGLTASLLALRFGRRGPLFGLFLVVLLSAVSVLSLEAVLRLFPAVLTGQAANRAYSGYHDLCGGIYSRDRNMVLALRPNFRREIYWNGHWWLHETNAAGYRGPEVENAAAVFLGDSMIYGHGVQNQETVPSQFAAHTDLTVANLGQQGTCAIQYWLRLREVGLALRPRVVFVCCHPNDIDEAPYFYGADELRRFINRPLDEDEPPVAQNQFLPQPWWEPERLWNDHLAVPLRVAGVLGGLKPPWQKTTQSDLPMAGAGVSGEHFLPDKGFVESPFAPWEPAAPEERRLGWQANVRALEKIARCCREQGATMVLFDLGYPHAFSQAIESEAGKLGVQYSPAGRIALTRALAGEVMYLANDGHWSAQGCDVVAQELAKEAPTGASAPDRATDHSP